MKKLIVIDLEADGNVVAYVGNVDKKYGSIEGVEGFFEELGIEVDTSVIDDLADRIDKYGYVRWRENFCFSVV